MMTIRLFLEVVAAFTLVGLVWHMCGIRTSIFVALVVFVLVLLSAKTAHAEPNQAPIYTTVYITKYALTRGILIEEAEIRNDGKVAVAQSGVYRNSEFWLNMDAAIKRSLVLRNNREKALERQRDRLQALRFQSNPTSPTPSH